MAKTGTVLISGYAKLPAHIPSEEVYKTLVVVALVDMEFGTIVDAECSVITSVAKDFIARLLIGYNLRSGPEHLFDRFERTFHGYSKKAIATALKMIFAKFEELQREP